MTIEDAKTITKGNEYASSFLGAWVAYCHLLDDIVDKDKEVTDQRLVREMLVFLEAIICNPWARDNMVLLWPLIVTSANAWLDANRIAAKNPQEADVLKGMYHEVVWFTAFLCGGQEHMQDITSRFREYDYEQQGEK
jgi:hypothetical protein